MSRTDKVIKGLSASYLSFAIKTILHFFLTPYFLAVLGPALWGLNSFLGEFFGYIMLSEFGLGTAVKSIVAKDIQEGKSSEIQNVTLKKIRSGNQIQHLLGLLFLIITIFITIFLERLVEGLPEEYIFMAKLFTLISGFSVALVFSSTTYVAVLNGKQLIAENTFYSLISEIIRSCLGFLLIYIGWMLYGIAAASVVATMYFFYQVRHRVKRLGVEINPFKTALNLKNARDLYNIGIWIVIANLGGLLIYKSQRIIIAVYPSLGLESVTIASLLMTVPMLLHNQSVRLSLMMQPGLTQLFHSKQGADKYRKPVILMVRLMAILSAIIFVGTYLINSSFIARWVGDKYNIGQSANILVAALFSLATINNAFKMAAQARFNFRLIGITSVASGVVGIILALVFAKPYGITGVLLGVVIGEIAVKVPLLQFYIIKKLKADESILALTFRLFWIPILFVLFWITVGKYITWRPETWIEIFSSAFIVGGATFLVGIAWIWKELKHYRPFNRIDEKLVSIFGGR
ncbi:hypothetical protein K9N50_05750 [bacterium]|nr:hypothetical protein [bacterium]